MMKNGSVHAVGCAVGRGQCDYQEQHKADFSRVMGLFSILIVTVVSTSMCDNS